MSKKKLLAEKLIVNSDHAFINKIINILENQALSPDVFSKELKGWKKECNPFSSWKNRNVVYNDFLNSEKTIKEIHKVSTKSFPTESTPSPPLYNSDYHLEEKNETDLDLVQIANNQSYLQVISVSAKNRAEHLSDRSDFYPVFAVLVSAVFAFIAYDIPELKYLFAFLSLAFLIVSVYIRLTTRRQVAELKMMANVLDLADKQFPKPASAKILPSRSLIFSACSSPRAKVGIFSRLVRLFLGKVK